MSRMRKPVTGRRNAIEGEDMQRCAYDCLLPLKHVEMYVIAALELLCGWPKKIFTTNTTWWTHAPWNMQYLWVCCLFLVDLCNNVANNVLNWNPDEVFVLCSHFEQSYITSNRNSQWVWLFSHLLNLFASASTFFLSILKSLVRILNIVGIVCCCPIRWCSVNPEVACSMSKMKLCDFVENSEQN